MKWKWKWVLSSPFVVSKVAICVLANVVRTVERTWGWRNLAPSDWSKARSHHDRRRRLTRSPCVGRLLVVGTKVCADDEKMMMMMRCAVVFVLILYRYSCTGTVPVLVQYLILDASTMNIKDQNGTALQLKHWNLVTSRHKQKDDC